ncbi:MAG: hypothetical protein Q8R39_00640 [bacterium]|nr:hypothetical protein [bacterium]MDZ4284937.1 hypothetical protein [Patescibacteria group bacterium]
MRKILITLLCFTCFLSYIFLTAIVVKTFFPDTRLYRAIQHIERTWHAPEAPPPIINVLEGTILPGQTVRLGEVSISLSNSASDGMAGTTTQFLWTFRNESTQKPFFPDRAMHNFLTHVYAWHENLAGAVVHAHPEQSVGASTEGPIEETIHFTHTGAWTHVMQFAYRGTVYNLYTPVIVPKGSIAQQSREIEPPDRGRVRGEDLNDVLLTTSPETIKKNVPTLLTFTFPNIAQADDIRPGLSGRNFIVALAGENLFWNEHGDGSVEYVSGQSQFHVVSQEPTRNAASYLTTFPRAGKWLVRFEDRGDHDFFVAVDE